MTKSKKPVNDVNQKIANALIVVAEKEGVDIMAFAFTIIDSKLMANTRYANVEGKKTTKYHFMRLQDSMNDMTTKIDEDLKKHEAESN